MLRDRDHFAVSLKNDDAVARQPFREHPDMLLKEKISAFAQLERSSNLEVIAKTLNIGLDALVFLDDNLSSVHSKGGITHGLLPNCPLTHLFFPCSLNAGYFETVSFFR